MPYQIDLQLVAHAMARARMPVRRAGRPARQIAMAARHQYASQLGHRH